MNSNLLMLPEPPQELVDIPESNLGDFSGYFKCLIYLIAPVIYKQVLEQASVSM